MIRRIGIIGVGAIGSVVGGLLTRAGHDVTLVDQWPDHVVAMKRHGLSLGGTCGELRVRVRALHLHEAQGIGEPFDAVFVAVKSYDTEWATALASAYLSSPHGVVVDFQNGINDGRVAALVGRERALGCVILIGAGMYEPGRALLTSAGRVGFLIGEHDGSASARAREIARIMNDVAPAEVTTNLWGQRWSKLALNCMVNPLAALSGLGTAEVRTDRSARRLAVHLGAEAIQVGRALGHDVEPIWGIAAQRIVDAAQGLGLDDVEAEIGRGVDPRGGGRPSMLQDVMRRRRTEIDHLNGYVVEHGRRIGVKTPLNEATLALFHRQPVGALQPDPQNLAPLLELLA